LKISVLSILLEVQQVYKTLHLGNICNFYVQTKYGSWESECYNEIPRHLGFLRSRMNIDEYLKTL